jgi:2-(1,2-epoxy-1,2-dihydrophenyl)acetyl-CoA isomerase
MADDEITSEPGFGASGYGFDHIGKTVLYDVNDEGTICTITLNRPESMNSMSPDLIQGACAALAMAASDPDLRVVILTGAGRGFCAGGDVKSMAGAPSKGPKRKPRPSPMDAGVWGLRSDMYSSELLRNMDKITIAAINGACAGAGFSWACAADLRFTQDKAKFTTAFVNVGLTGDFGGTWTLPRIVGAGKARELYLTSPVFTGDEAEKIGLVTKSLETPEEMMAHVMEVAETLADRAPIALQRIKANLNDADTNTFSEGLNNEAERHAKSGRHPQMGIAAAAFVGRTKPDFSKSGMKKEVCVSLSRPLSTSFLTTVPLCWQPWMMTKL